MSKRAEDAAQKAYPYPDFTNIRETDAGIIAAQSTNRARTYFIEGYKQAEKDLALTVEDMKLIVAIYDSMNDEGRDSGFFPPDWWGTEAFYDELLRRYNEDKSID